MEIVIIGIGGSGPRAGKDTLARFAEEWFHYNLGVDNLFVEPINLADELKKQYAHEHNLKMSTLYDTVKKEQHRPGLITHGAKKRRQDRAYWPKALTKAFAAKLDEDEVLTPVVLLPVADIRYPQELDLPVYVHQAIKSRYPDTKIHFTSIYVDTDMEILRQRSGLKSDEQFEKIMYDASETCLGPDDFAVRIQNNGTLAEFAAKSEAVFNKWFGRLVNATLEKEAR